ncbi:purple acid phosphatase family protein [Flexithrix dorotheae]|uniref:purple acid phosphatase family protein n=1 Tax=Flexithrix dorotheae TaxID=70993 RepID=UPI00036B5B04|nr:metallophosphoesterase family protein [Flexithrix dorotheae]
MRVLGYIHIINLFVILVFFTRCNQPAHDHDHDHGHHHHSSSYFDGISDKLLFPSKSPDRVILNLTANPMEAVAVNWRTDTTITSGVVEVAIASAGPEIRQNPRKINAKTSFLKSQHENEPEIFANYHEAIIDNLKPGEKYAYRVGQGDSWSEWYQYQMPDPENRPISFIYFGDAQNDVKSMWSRVIREAYKTLPEVDFMLHAGDLINRHNRDVEWGEWFHAGGFLHAMVPSVMTPGNHEYKNVVLSPQWKPQFNLPKNGPKGLEETCYFIDYPDFKVISLDAEQIDESEAFRDAQKQWLDSLLAANPKKWTAITFHYPVFSTKPNRDNEKLREYFKPIFDKYKVDIVLQGHDHAYGRGMVNNVPTGSNVREQSSGTMYVVSVSGPKMYDVSDDEWMERRAGNTQLFQIISIENNILSYEAFSADGKLYDAFDLQKSEGKPNKLVNRIPDVEERLLEQ